MRRGDLHGARTLLGVGILVRNDWNEATDDWQNSVPADQVTITFVLRVHRNTRVAQHRLGTRGRNRDVSRGVLGIVELPLDGITEVPEIAVHLLLLNL